MIIKINPINTFRGPAGPVGPAAQTDTSLTTPGMSADAAAVGEALKNAGGNFDVQMTLTQTSVKLHKHADEIRDAMLAGKNVRLVEPSMDMLCTPWTTWSDEYGVSFVGFSVIPTGSALLLIFNVLPNNVVEMTEYTFSGTVGGTITGSGGGVD